MKGKKIIAMLLALAFMLVAVGCTAGQPTPPPVATPVEEYGDDDLYEYNNENDYEYGGEYQDVFEGERFNEEEFVSEDVQITIAFDKPEYTHSDIVLMIATITNIGDYTISFTKGSGSNLVPDALRVELGEFTPLFIPLMMTMDLQTVVLAPDESATFELTFAPYMYANTDAALPPMVGLDRDIEFFQADDEWVRVVPGEIQGSVQFSYVLRGEDDESMLVVEGDDIIVLEGNFTVNLTE